MVLRFETAAPPSPSARNRMDVACFVGFVPRRADTATPPSLARWLATEGWVDSVDAHPDASAEELLHVPVPIESWDAFVHLFGWDERPLEANLTSPMAATYLGVAVRAFFAHGGRRCVVVRCGDPWPARSPRADRLAALDSAIPGYSGQPAERAERKSWRGLAVLHGLPEVATVCLPDLCDAVAEDIAAPTAETPAIAWPEVFVECTAPPAGPPTGQTSYRVRAPRLAEGAGMADWYGAVRLVARFLSQHRRDVQLLAALPLPEREAPHASDMLSALLADGALRGPDAGGFAGRFVQLAWPWVG